MVKILKSKTYLTTRLSAPPIDGRRFDPSKGADKITIYEKNTMATKVVRGNKKMFRLMDPNLY